MACIGTYSLETGFNFTLKVIDGLHHRFQLKAVMGLKKTLNGSK